MATEPHIASVTLLYPELNQVYDPIIHTSNLLETQRYFLISYLSHKYCDQQIFLISVIEI